MTIPSLEREPLKALAALDRALRDLTMTAAPEYEAELDYPLHVGVEGSLGARSLNPRTLATRFLGQLVSVEGIVTKCSLVRPKVVKSVHFCESTKAFHRREYRDATTAGIYNPTSSAYPTKVSYFNSESLF